MKPRIFDAFPMAGTPTELTLVECRFDELYDTVDAFIVVEADVDHQDHPKPYHFEANRDRYDRWSDKIVYVKASGLPTMAEDSWSWAREHAQREWIVEGLKELDPSDDDILLQSDLDEIPRPLMVRNVRPRGIECVTFLQRGHFWAIDWEYPPPWAGTVATRIGTIARLSEDRKAGPMTAMREKRNMTPLKLPNAGWHFSWLGGSREAWMQKVNSFCHPEVEERIKEYADSYFEKGIHVDGEVMKPVDVDHTWPRWMQQTSNVPKSWLRPR